MRLYYLRARYYDPKLGRFINEDTYEGQINNPLTLNLYTYCINNPLIYVDPTGHENRFAVSEGGGGGVDPVSLGYLLWEGVKGVGKWVLRGVGIGVAAIPVYETVTNISSSKEEAISVPTPCPAPTRSDTQGSGKTISNDDYDDYYGTGSKERVGKQKGSAPRNNQKQNEQTDKISKDLRLTKEQSRQLHDYISGQGYSYKEILDIAKDLFGKK